MDPTGIRDYIEDLMSKKHLSLIQLAELLGYKSTTSLKRLMCGTVQTAGCHKFSTLVMNTFDLSPEEKDELALAVKNTLLTKEKKRNIVEMWDFLSLGKYTNIVSNSQITVITGNEKQSLVERYHQKKNIYILMINCFDPALFDDLAILLKSYSAKIDHYLFFDNDPANTIRSINSLMKVFYYTGYDAWYAPSSLQQTDQVISANALYVTYRDEKDIEKQDILLAVGNHEFILAETANGSTLMSTYLKSNQSLIQLKHTYFTISSIENYVDYSTAYAELEHDCAIWKIKPDIGIDYIPCDILYAALNEGGAVDGKGFSDILEPLIDIYSKRVKNTYEKHRPIHTVMKQSAMLEFARTGRQTDHFWGMRPYTKAERKRILELLLEHQKNNVYFNLHFLKDDSLIRDVEIACYEGKGFLLLESGTSYLLSDNHSEILLSCKTLEKEFIEFFRKELISKYCISYQECVNFLNRLIRMCS